MVEYLPYVNSYGQLKELFKRIKEASVPPKFTQDFLSTVLNLKSSSFRPMIPFLKKLGFLDTANVPTKVYTDFRDETISKIIMARQIRSTYDQLYTAHAYAHKLDKEAIISKLSSVLGTSKDDGNLPTIASTFSELCKLADFEGKPQPRPTPKPTVPMTPVQLQVPAKLGISYTINLNLPPTTDIEVFNAIFKALKENLLK